MRLFFAIAIWTLYPPMIRLTDQPKPVGLAKLGIDFTFLCDPAIYATARWTLLAGLIAFVIGRGLWIVLPLVFLIVVSIGTLESSQGASNHTDVIVSLVLLSLMVYHVYARIAKRELPRRLVNAQSIFVAQMTVAAAYVVSAVSKINGKGNWLLDAMQNYPLQMVKTERQNYYNALNPEPAMDRKGFVGMLADWAQPIAGPMEQLLMNSVFSRGIMLGSGFLLELLAIFALVGRKCSAVFGVGLLMFHFAIYLVMGLNFHYHMAVVLIFLVNLPYWLRKLSIRIVKALSRPEGMLRLAGS